MHMLWCHDVQSCCASAAKVKLRESDFRPTIALNRNLTIAASGDTSTGSEPVLDFGHGIDYILVSCGADAGPDQCSCPCSRRDCNLPR